MGVGRTQEIHVYQKGQIQVKQRGKHETVEGPLSLSKHAKGISGHITAIPSMVLRAATRLQLEKDKDQSIR